VASYGDTCTPTTVFSSIISANQGTDVDFVFEPINSFISNGYNLIGDGNATGAFNQTGDQTGVSDPGLDPLGSYGGPTQTHRLQSDSPAVDDGPPPTSCPPPATDQRGVDRPQDGDDDGTANCDIGAFELEPPNVAPRVTVAQGGSCGADHRSGTLRLRVSDVDDPASVLSLRATSSNRALLPDANISFGGTGANRTMTLRPLDGKSGTALVRITVSDGSLMSTRVLTVKVGTNGVDAINGTARADVLFGLDGVDALNGLGGNDLLCGGKGVDALNGGNGDDTLLGGPGKDTLKGGSDDDGLFGGSGNDWLFGDNGADRLGGGAGSDSFSGGAGEDVATDFDRGEGDTKDSTIP
jgi:Ca2+-binding RTX toxin-like protein